MRVLVLSDTHGLVQPAIDVYKRLQEEAPVDRIVHLGDLYSDAKALRARLGAEVTAVKGNMDGSYSENDYEIMETEYGKLLLTHGHMENVKFSTQTLLYRAEELGCRAALFGHTHSPCFVDAGGIYLLNPGSLTRPRGGGDGSYAVLTVTETELRASILFYHPGPPKVKSGVLRDMLNNSDRF